MVVKLGLLELQKANIIAKGIVTHYALEHEKGGYT